MAGDVSSVQLNDVAVGQTGSLVNTCDETGGGVNQATCENNDALNFLGPLTQANGVDASTGGTAVQSNGAQVAQNLDAVNDCDEDGTGFNNAECDNELKVTNNIESITQENDGILGDDLVQTSFVAINQDLQLDNICDETGVGDNSAICHNDHHEIIDDNLIGPVDQSNDASGSGDADFAQNNNIPSINQVLVAQNDCDQTDEQTAQGINDAICSNDDPKNEIDSITQDNLATGTHVDDIFQDNTGSFSQIMTLNTGCDATTFTDSGDNNAVCSNDRAENFINSVDQSNDATGNDDVLIDQDNSVAVAQALTANSDCDSTAENNANCENDDAESFIETITQDNTATGDGFAQILQGNDATFAQNIGVLNSCDESGAGIIDPDSVCDNDDAQNFIGPVVQTNTATGAAQSDTVAQSNVAQVTQNLLATNDCNEANTGDNVVDCNNDNSRNSIPSITQTNDAAGGDDTVQLNFVGMSQDTQLENVCDETGIGDNNADCNNDFAGNFIGPLTQSNDAQGSGDADFTQNNNIPTINQVIDAENDCDQSDEQTASGSNSAICSNELAGNGIASIEQTNDAAGTHVDDIFQDNNGAFSQVMTLQNGCDATTFSSSGDNFVDRCDNDREANSIGPVSQTNTATGLDDVLIDQDNNVAVSQVLSANNDCDATASNFADCSNFESFNTIDSITQDNTATGDGFASISQSNEATIDQNMDLLNSCDESGDGVNDADCDNDAFNLIGPIFQSNDANGADNSVVTQSNIIDVTQNLEGTNDCDEANTGDNNAQCSTDISQ